MSEALLNHLREKRGNAGKIARAFDITREAVWHWTETRVPAERVIALEQLIGIPRHLIRPDLYPAPGSPIPSSQSTASM